MRSHPSLCTQPVQIGQTTPRLFLKGKKKIMLKKLSSTAVRAPPWISPAWKLKTPTIFSICNQHIGETGCPKRTKKCQNMSKYVQIFYRISKYVKIFQNMSKNVKICQNMSKNEINVATPLPHMRKICVDSILSWIVGLI